jgi:hypothetical protein
LPSGSSTKGRRLAREALVPALSRTFRLALLAPDLIEAIVAGRVDQSLVLERLERSLPASWVDQRARILESKASLAA